MFLRPGFLPGFRGCSWSKTCGWGTGAEPEPAEPETDAEPEPEPQPEAKPQPRAFDLLCCKRFALDAGRAPRIRSWPRGPGRKPGRRKNGVPCGAPRSGAACRGKRACSSTWMCELRSGLQGASTAGNPGCTMHPGRGSGVHLSWLLLSGHSERSDSAAGRNAFAVASKATSDKPQATAKIASGARAHRRRSLARSPRSESADSPPRERLPPTACLFRQGHPRMRRTGRWQCHQFHPWRPR